MKKLAFLMFSIILIAIILTTKGCFIIGRKLSQQIMDDALRDSCEREILMAISIYKYKNQNYPKTMNDLKDHYFYTGCDHKNDSFKLTFLGKDSFLVTIFTNSPDSIFIRATQKMHKTYLTKEGIYKSVEFFPKIE